MPPVLWLAMRRREDRSAPLMRFDPPRSSPASPPSRSFCEDEDSLPEKSGSFFHPVESPFFRWVGIDERLGITGRLNRPSHLFGKAIRKIA